MLFGFAIPTLPLTIAPLPPEAPVIVNVGGIVHIPFVVTVQARPPVPDRLTEQVSALPPVRVPPERAQVPGTV